MQIFVTSLDKTFTVNIEENANLTDLKSAIEDVEFIPSEYMRIVSGTRTLTSTHALGLTNADSVTLLLDVFGGMRAKWRKKRMRRLRRKRRKMRQRAR
jgi:hypothetical protein